VVIGAERERVEGFGRLEDGLLSAGEWYRWGPYVSERQWGTVREDYSADGNAWDYLPHDHARSRAYRWGEDGLAGFCDIHQRLCLSLAPKNSRAAANTDPVILPLESQTNAPEALVMTRPGSLPEDHPLSSAALPSARSSSA
jgi:hypothetical protein